MFANPYKFGPERKSNIIHEKMLFLPIKRAATEPEEFLRYLTQQEISKKGVKEIVLNGQFFQNFIFKNK